MTSIPRSEGSAKMDGNHLGMESDVTRASAAPLSYHKQVTELQFLFPGTQSHGTRRTIFKNHLRCFQDPMMTKQELVFKILSNFYSRTMNNSIQKSWRTIRTAPNTAATIVYMCFIFLLLLFCSGVIPVLLGVQESLLARFREPYVMPAIKPVLATCKASAYPLSYFSSPFTRSLHPTRYGAREIMQSGGVHTLHVQSSSHATTGLLKK